jgi:transposase
MPLILYTPPHCSACTLIRRRSESYRVSRPLRPCRTSIAGRRSTWRVWSPSNTNPVLKRFYRRLREAGKPARLALVAAMRKFQTILNVGARQRLP